MTAAFKIVSQNSLSQTNCVASQANIFSSMLTLLNSESKTLPCKNLDSFALHLKATLYKKHTQIQNTVAHKILKDTLNFFEDCLLFH